MVGAIMFGVFCLGTTFLATGGGDHFFGGPLTASSEGPSGGVTIQKSPSPSHSQPTPIKARPSVCNKEIAALLPPGTKSSASLLPCYKLAPLPSAIAVHREPNEGG